MTTTETRTPDRRQGEDDHGLTEAVRADENLTALYQAWQLCKGAMEGQDISREAKAALREHGGKEWAEDLEGTAEAIQAHLRDEPISLMLRSGWCQPGEEMTPAEVELLLTTGGPALRLLCDVEGGELSRPRLQYQDWWKPWTEMVTKDTEAWEWFAGLFFVGEC